MRERGGSPDLLSGSGVARGSLRSRGGTGDEARDRFSSSSKKDRRVVGSVDWSSACVKAMISFSASVDPYPGEYEQLDEAT